MNSEHRWLIGGLIGLAVIALTAGAFAIGYSAGQDEASEPTTIGEKLQAWTDCLNEAGANVPTVQATGDGGFTVTVSGSALEDLDVGGLLLALPQCADLAPGVPLSMLGPLVGPMLGGHGMMDQGPSTGQGPGDGRFEVLCERLRQGDVAGSDVPEALLDLCGLGGDG